MSKRQIQLLLLVLAFGYLVLAWAAYDLSTRSYRYWHQGQERTALVSKLDHTSGTVRGGTTYHYEIHIEDRAFVNAFPQTLTIGERYKVLEVPGDTVVILGSRDSNLFQVFSAQIGGYLMACAIAAFLPWILIFGPFAFVRIVKAADEARL